MRASTRLDDESNTNQQTKQHTKASRAVRDYLRQEADSVQHQAALRHGGRVDSDRHLRTPSITTASVCAFVDLIVQVTKTRTTEDKQQTHFANSGTERHAQKSSLQ